MFEYEMFQARATELHRAAAHDRQVRKALLGRREARRRARANDGGGKVSTTSSARLAA